MIKKMEYKIGYKLKNQTYKLMGNAERELLMLNDKQRAAHIY